MIGYGDRKCAPYHRAVPMIWDDFSIFSTNCAITLRHTRAHAARIFADVARGKWRPNSKNIFMLLAKFEQSKTVSILKHRFGCESAHAALCK